MPGDTDEQLSATLKTAVIESLHKKLADKSRTDNFLGLGSKTAIRLLWVVAADGGAGWI